LPRLKEPVMKLQDKLPVLSVGMFLAAIVVFLDSWEWTNSFIAQKFLVGFAAAWILAMIVYGRSSWLSSLLDLRALQFLGKVSYSFYLYHFIVHNILYMWLVQTVPSPIILRWPLVLELVLIGGSVAIAIGIAVISYTCIERPFIHLGKQMLDSNPAGVRVLSYQSDLPGSSEEIRGSLPSTER
ncbi:MAG: hypothetical protein MN733_05690, partial [Nitrososphaera sp.]|nr:hypothetical protein [Nitrososphaera sp.]